MDKYRICKSQSGLYKVQKHIPYQENKQFWNHIVLRRPRKMIGEWVDESTKTVFQTKEKAEKRVKYFKNIDKGYVEIWHTISIFD